MPKKKNSILSEVLVWAGLTLISAVLALPLVMAEHQLKINDFIEAPARVSVSPRPAPQLDLPAEISALAGDFDSLRPNPGLLADLSGKCQARVAFNASLVDYESMIEKIAGQHEVSPLLVKAVIQAESNFNPSAVSHKGAVGLMQVMPSTARSMGVLDPMDPQKNIVAGVKYLKTLLVLFNDDEKLAIAAYNCGPEAMKRWGNEVPPYRETRTFVDRVMNYYNQHLES